MATTKLMYFHQDCWRFYIMLQTQLKLYVLLAAFQILAFGMWLRSRCRRSWPIVFVRRQRLIKWCTESSAKIQTRWYSLVGAIAISNAPSLDFATSCLIPALLSVVIVDICSSHTAFFGFTVILLDPTAKQGRWKKLTADTVWYSQR